MARRQPETIVKRQREQALREKRERKQAKKDARAAEKLNPTAEGTDDVIDADENDADGTETPPDEPQPNDQP